MWPFKKNKFKNLKREEIVDAIYELEKQEKLIEDLIIEKQEEVDHLLAKGKKEKSEELRLLYAKKISHLKQEMQTDISKGSYLLYNIKLMKKLKDAVDDKEFFVKTTNISLGNLLQDQKGLAKFLNQALNTKIRAEDVLTIADETFSEIQDAYEPNKEIYGVDKNEDELLAVFDAAEPEEEIAKSNTSNLIHEEVEDKIAAASSEE
ncbi:MAG: hypothetical protein ACOX6H_04505 [Christensenellales bacterium]|jgi:hypothetical protein